jgi:hypothetical protein
MTLMINDENFIANSFVPVTLPKARDSIVANLERLDNRSLESIVSAFRQLKSIIDDTPMTVVERATADRHLKAIAALLG